MGLQDVRRDDRTPMAIVGVFHRHKLDAGRVVSALPQLARHHGRVGNPALAGVTESDHARQGPGGSGFVVHHVRLFFKECGVARARVHHQGNLVAHGAAGHKHGRRET